MFQCREPSDNLPIPSAISAVNLCGGSKSVNKGSALHRFVCLLVCKNYGDELCLLLKGICVFRCGRRIVGG